MLQTWIIEGTPVRAGAAVRIKVGSWVPDEKSRTGKSYVEDDREVDGVVYDCVPARNVVRVSTDQMMSPGFAPMRGMVEKRVSEVVFV